MPDFAKSPVLQIGEIGSIKPELVLMTFAVAEKMTKLKFDIVIFPTFHFANRSGNP
ncbi:hypothetical protein SDC9_186113 [bioreactor metagenome]|uniref:Uncharacterized protein n=1 Tax=bioreactor metagenome TaxID=1076179 RepID=A0A645HK69_9ZZZZ